MNTQIVAIVIAEGSKLIGQYFRNRPIRLEPQASPRVEPTKPRVVLPETTEVPLSDASGVEAGCVPCALGHFGTCSGLLNEGVRFANKDGLNDEVFKRVNICLDELNAMERVDLRPEMIVNLPDWEKELASQALVASRATRHRLEGMTEVSDLEKVAASTQSSRQAIGQAYFKRRMEHMTPEDKEALRQKVVDKLEEIEEGESDKPSERR